MGRQPSAQVQAIGLGGGTTCRMTRTSAAAQAMADTADEWAKITRRTGEDKIIDAIKANKAAWPTVLDPI